MGTMDTLKISSAIKSWRVHEAAAAPALPAYVPADIDPRFVRIEKRDEGTWESITAKVRLPTKTIYVVMGFGRVCGMQAGREVCIERPLEVFVPAGQDSGDPQWISATMRSLSLAARGGFLAKGLADLRQVKSMTPIWYGKSRSGKGLCHDSEVAAIAWAIQDELQRRGYFDELYNERPLADLVDRYERLKQYRDALNLDSPSRAHVAVSTQPAPAAPAPTKTTLGKSVVGTCPNQNCQGDMIILDGCPTCKDCSYSKCG